MFYENFNSVLIYDTAENSGKRVYKQRPASASDTNIRILKEDLDPIFLKD